MNSASCNGCGAAYDVTGKPAGATFSCGKCEGGVIVVPDATAIGSLDGAEEIGSADELAEEVSAPVGSADELAEEVADAVAEEGVVVRPSRPRRSRERTPSASGSNRGLLIGGGLLVAAVAVGAVMSMGGGDDSPTPTGGGARASSDADVDAPSTPTDPAASARASIDDLAPDDLAGRVELAQRCAELGLDDERRALLLEILLLDADHAETRTELGFQRYTGDHPRYQGRWLTADEAARIAASE